jgi:hypothetical protein
MLICSIITGNSREKTGMRATILWGHTMGLYNKLYPDMFLCDEVAYLRKKHVSWANSDQIGIIFAGMILGWYLYITCII